MGLQEEMEEVSRIEDGLKKLRIDLVWAQYWEQKNGVRAHILCIVRLAFDEAMTPSSTSASSVFIPHT